MYTVFISTDSYIFVDFFIQPVFLLQADKNRIEEEFSFEELHIIRDLAYRKVKEQGALFKVRQIWKIHHYLNDLLNCCTFNRKFFLFLELSSK